VDEVPDHNKRCVENLSPEEKRRLFPYLLGIKQANACIENSSKHLIILLNRFIAFAKVVGG